MRLESLDTIPTIVNVICADSETKVVPKCRCVEEVTTQVVSNDTPIQDFVHVQRDHANPPYPHPNDPTSSSRVSGEEVQQGSQKCLLKSTLTPKLAMEMYLEDQDNLKVALKKNSLEDHRWSLKSWDEHNVRIVKIVCHECPKEMGGVWNAPKKQCEHFVLKF